MHGILRAVSCSGHINLQLYAKTLSGLWFLSLGGYIESRSVTNIHRGLSALVADAI